MDGETNQFETPGAPAGAHAAETPAPAPLPGPEPEVLSAESAEVPDVPDVPAPVAKPRLSPERLCDYLARATFASTLGRRGYQQDEVDAFLVRLADAIHAGEPLQEIVRRNRFSTVRLEDGYDTHQVDHFLAAVVDLDPNAAAGERPQPGRSGLLTKLFG